jgi:hypothetical protein
MQKKAETEKNAEEKLEEKFSLTEYQKFKLDIFKMVFEVTKNNGSSYALTNDIERWLLVNKNPTEK